MKSIRDADFRYTTAEESRKPGYLARKFAKLRAEMKAAAEQQQAKVTPLKKAAK